MPQRSLVCLILVCFLVVVTAGSALAAQTFAVASFKIHAPEKYQYLSHGIPSMITSRLSSGTSLRVSEKPVLSEARELSRDKAREILAQADLEYLVYGSVTVMQEQSSLSLKVLSGEDKLITRTSQMPLDKLIPRLDTMVGEIKQELGLVAEAPAGSGGQAEVSGGETRAETAPEKATEQKKLNARFEEKEKVQRKEGEDKINPQFEHTKKEQRESGRWQSPELSFPAHGMQVGDVDGDGREEIFLLQKHAVKAFVKRKSGIEHLATHETGSRTRALTLDLFAPSSDGSRQIVVSAVNNKKPSSFILRFQEGRFTVQDKDIRLFLNVVRPPPEYEKRLVGQKLSAPGKFANGIRYVERGEKGYELGEKLDLPFRANLFNFAYLPQKEGYKVVLAKSSDYLQIYSSGNKKQASTEHRFAGSDVRIRKKASLPGLDENPDDPKHYYYLPTRLLPCNLDGDSEFEILVNRIFSTSSKYFSRQRNFSRGEIYSLYWDDLGLSTAWKTGTIKGKVHDYGLGDINNNGKIDLYICLNTQPGTFSWGGEKTVLLAYPLELPQHSREALFRP